MILKPQDSIHQDDMDRYKTFMAQVQGHHYLDMYFKDDKIQVDIFEYPADTIVASGLFEPSSVAYEYFEQQENFARELGIDSFTNYDQTTEGGTGTTGGKLERADCARSPSTESLSPDELVSRCFQFCSVGASCIRSCPHCYYVRGDCRWQKWCI